MRAAEEGREVTGEEEPSLARARAHRGQELLDRSEALLRGDPARPWVEALQRDRGRQHERAVRRRVEIVRPDAPRREPAVVQAADQGAQAAGEARPPRGVRPGVLQARHAWTFLLGNLTI